LRLDRLQLDLARVSLTFADLRGSLGELQFPVQSQQKAQVEAASSAHRKYKHELYSSVHAKLPLTP